MFRGIDVCVVGAGPAGAIAARELARAGAVVALIADDCPTTPIQIGETIPAGADTLLKRIDLGNLLATGGHLASTGNASRWGSEELHCRESIFNCDGSGWHVDRRSFNERLVIEAATAGVRIVAGKMESTSTARGYGCQISVRVRDRELLMRAQYAIDCSGRSARLAHANGAKRRVHDKLVAIWTLLERLPDASGTNACDDFDRQTYVEAAPNGWWYSARVPGSRRVLAFFTDGDLLDRSALGSVDGFRLFMEQYYHVHALAPWHAYRNVAPPICVPAMSARLNRAHGPGWVAAGDAAQSFDPLSSDGILAAMVGGAAAAAAIVNLNCSLRSAMDDYQARLDEHYIHYLAKRRMHYCGEGRWSGNPFWRRRQQSNRDSWG